MNQLQIPFWLNVFHAGAPYLVMAPDFMQDSLENFCVFQRIFLRRLFIFMVTESWNLHLVRV